MLSPEGRCKTLDASADGYGRAEGCGVILLVPMLGEKNHRRKTRDNHSMAQNSGTNPIAVLSGSAVNQDGRSSSLTAPNGPAQQQVFRQALKAAGVEPGAIAALQMHGTGTPLGDPIEVGAAAAVLTTGKVSSRGATVREALPFTLQSSKSSSGHAEPASGVIREGD